MRRRRVVVGVTTCLGTALLRRSLATPPGSRQFYVSTNAVAGVWAVGGIAAGRAAAAGPVAPGSSTGRLVRHALLPVAAGAGAFAVFYGAALVARRIPPLDAALTRVLAYAGEGDERLVLLTTLANGAGEELFFRGALYDEAGDHPVVVSTAVYTLSTIATRNPALVLAAAVMGSVFGLQRRASGGVLAPTVTHLTWSALMVRYVAPLFGRDRATTRR